MLPRGEHHIDIFVRDRGPVSGFGEGDDSVGIGDVRLYEPDCLVLRSCLQRLVKYGMAVSGSRVGVLADPDRHDPRWLRRQKGLSGQRLSLVAHFGRDRFRQSRAPSTSEVTTRWRWG
jgi:hypothetical protein